MSELFSKRLAISIAKSGKQKGDLANHCGVALSTVSRWLGGSIPKVETVAKIAEFLSVDARWLLDSNTGFSDFLENRDFLTAMSEANFELGRDRRIRELAMEAEEAFSNRLSRFSQNATRTLREAIRLCEMIHTAGGEGATSEENAILARDLIPDLNLLLSEIQKVKSESIALRHLAESSPTMMRVLRSK